MSITANNLKIREVINQVVNDPTYKAVSNVPLFSSHQIGLILLSYFMVFGSIYLYLSFSVSLWIVYPIMIFGFYTAFTPLHDSTHMAISSNKFLNDLLGTISGTLVYPMVNAAGYRYIHLSHHRYVGDKNLDPDEPMVSIPTKHFPFGYLLLLVADFLWIYWLFFKVWKRTPMSMKINIIGMAVANITFNTLWFVSPYWLEFLVLFFIPNRLGNTYTAFAFAHLPHPEGLQWNDYPLQSTFKLKGNQNYLASLWGQAHHAMHHFLPHIPWYKYQKVWGLANGAFTKEYIPERDVMAKPDPHFKNKISDLKEIKDKPLLKVQVTSVEDVCLGVKSFVFEPLNENNLPTFTAGSHIDVVLPSGKVRQYSLVNPPYDKNKYQIAVKVEKDGRGGSKEMHSSISVGDTIEISRPKNNFLLYENVKRYILISGGIGITPMLSMAHRLTEIDKHFELHTCTKNLQEVPFQYELKNWTFAPNVEIHLDKDGKSSVDLNNVLASPNQDTLVYVCGPGGFNQWVHQTALKLGWTKDQIKQEVFSMDNASLSVPKPFKLKLNKSGKELTVGKDETIIDALLFNNIKVEYSCLQGTCGTCITNAIEGEIDHRDAVLSQEEKRQNNKLCLCVSRAKNEVLVLDL